jgi:hypothetical protein
MRICARHQKTVEALDLDLSTQRRQPGRTLLRL